MTIIKIIEAKLRAKLRLKQVKKIQKYDYNLPPHKVTVLRTFDICLLEFVGRFVGGCLGFRFKFI